jgi:ribosomal protein L7Ae-like RNA K-turn-binding protein
VKLQRQRLIDAIGFARRAGSAVAGFEKVEALAHRNRLHCLLIASDAGKDGTRKLEAAARTVYVIDNLDSAALGGIFGAIGIVVYAGISDKVQAARLISLAARLTALMPAHGTME